MTVVTSYPSQHFPITLDDANDVSYKDNTGEFTLSGLMPLADGVVTIWLEDDDAADFPAGIAYPAVAGSPIIGRIRRVFATGTTLLASQVVGFQIKR